MWTQKDTQVLKSAEIAYFFSTKYEFSTICRCSKPYLKRDLRYRLRLIFAFLYILKLQIVFSYLFQNVLKNYYDSYEGNKKRYL